MIQKLKLLDLFIIFVLLNCWISNAAAMPRIERFAISNIPTPVLNTSDFNQVFGGADGNTLAADSCGQIRSLEFVAFPDTVFSIVSAFKKGNRIIFKVTSDEYPVSGKNLYIDSRFVSISHLRPESRSRELPPFETIISRLLAAQGARYVWGGNFVQGVPQMLLFYQPANVPEDRELLNRWMLSGVDCSGLLYEATDGFTPRNTSQLVNYGKAVRIMGASAEEIAARVKPLDLITWNGHVMIVIDSEKVIESRPGCHGEKGGVALAPLVPALERLMRTRMPLDVAPFNGRHMARSFLIRRWYPDSNRNN